MFSFLLSLMNGVIEPNDLIMDKTLNSTPEIRKNKNKNHEKKLSSCILQGITFDILTPTIVNIAEARVNNMVDFVLA